MMYVYLEWRLGSVGWEDPIIENEWERECDSAMKLYVHFIGWFKVGKYIFIHGSAHVLSPDVNADPRELVN